jgi:hypothetical protein
MKSGNDWLTIAAIGVLAMCVVTFDHEGLGHGSACLLLHGHITLVSSSIFHCSARSGWIDPAGPATNLLMGTAALIVSRFVPTRLSKLKLFLIAVTAFSYFWEAGYVIDAMRSRHGDLYFFAQFMLGDVPLWLRWAAAACGVVLYMIAIRLTSRALLNLWPDPLVARRVARTLWIAASVGAALAALAITAKDGAISGMPCWKSRHAHFHCCSYRLRAERPKRLRRRSSSYAAIRRLPCLWSFSGYSRRPLVEASRSDRRGRGCRRFGLEWIGKI